MSTEELRQLGAGTRLGRYTLVRKIAAGGMAEVYVARSQGISGFEKKVAIKKILPQFSLNERFIDMLVDEAKITVSLTHPNIAQIYELGLEGDTYYIVMEFVDGRPLNRLMQRLDQEGGRNVPVVHAAHIMAEVAKGLHHAHTQKDARGEPLGIIHRDISPQNILLAYSGDVKLIDFGIARARGRVAQTSVGTIKGKLRYLAPEIAMADRPDHRADIYCCGIVLFEMLTGEALFTPKTDLEAIEMASAARVRSPRLSNPNVPLELEGIVMKALRRNRDERYSQAKDLYADLRRFLNHNYPAYVGSELGDLMEETFELDLEEERNLDRRAESIVDKLDPIPDEATLGVSAREFAGAIRQEQHTKSNRVPVPRQQRRSLVPLPEESESELEPYRAVVTRTSIELASESYIDGYDEDEEDVEATQQAENPLYSPTPKIDRAAPTIAFEAHDDPGIEETARGSKPRHKDPATSRLPRSSIRPKRNPAPAIILGMVCLVIVGLGLWFGARTIKRGESHSSKPQNIKPVPPEVIQTGSIELEVSPDVAIDVYINDDLIQKEARAPVRIENLEPEVQQRIRISAAGYRTLETKETLLSGQKQKLKLTLEPMLGEIELLALPPNATVEASLGKVRGRRIIELPLGQEVKITVRRKKLRTWSKTLTVKTESLVRLEVPVGAPIRPGTLFVNSRPFSKVYVNGRSKGRTPVKLKLPAGSYRLMLKRPDGKTHSRKVRISSGRKQSVVYRWP